MSKKKEEVSERNVRVTFEATVGPYDGKKFTAADIRRELRDDLQGSAISGLRKIVVEDV